MIKTFIFFNGLYDICCGLSILITDKYLSRLHLQLFIKEPNEITKRFLSYWIMTYGIIRTAIGFYPESIEIQTLTIISYIIEFVFFEYESYISNNLYKNKITSMNIFIIVIIIIVIIYMVVLDK